MDDNLVSDATHTRGLVHGEDFQPIPPCTSFGYPLKLPDRSEATPLEAEFGIMPETEHVGL